METVPDRHERELCELRKRHQRENCEIKERHKREVQEVQERHQRENRELEAMGGSLKRRRVPTPAAERLRNPCIYVVGGKSGAVTFSSVEKFCPKMEEWGEVDSMSAKRGRPAVAVLHGVLYAMGGFDFRSSPLATVEQFDTMSAEWQKMVPMLVERADFAAAALGGAIYAVGGTGGEGEELATVERFDPEVRAWVEVEPMATPRCGHCVAALGELVYVLGGYNGDCVVATMECYDPRRGTWRTLAPMSEARKDFAAAVLDGELYVLGGQDDDGQLLDTVERFDPLAPGGGAWSAVKRMSCVRGAPAAAVLGGELYAMGGLDNEYSKLDSVERFVPRANVWVKAAPMGTAKSDHVAAVLADR